MCYKESATDLAATQSRCGRRFDEECQHAVAALASKPGAQQEQVARALGVSPHGVARWQQQYGRASAASAPGVNVAELARRAGTRENAGLREQRTLRGKKAVAIFSEPPRQRGR